MPDMLLMLAGYWPSIAAFALFGLLHSIGARESYKEAIGRLIGPFAVAHFWRLVYCVLSFAWFYHVIGPLHWEMHPGNDRWLFVYPYWLWEVITVLHIGSIAFIYAAFFQSDYLEFLGLRQAWRGALVWMGGSHVSEMLQLFGTGRLETHGVYRVVRHPMLVGGLLYLITSGPSINNVLFALMYLSYMLLGGHYEERRLIRIFGEEYVGYRRRVGGYLPRLYLRRPG
jgi:protein-S-isoprenylcysteine O-methyltransferase Ste14